MAPQQPLDVVGLGYCCPDELLLLTEIPPPEGRAIIRRRERHGGGMVATAMVAVARLGGHAGFMSAIGDDDRGGWIQEEFQRYGVDTSRSVIRPGARSHQTVVLVDGSTGARSFLSDRGDVTDIVAEELDRDYITGASMLHLSDASPAALLAARWAKEAGKAVCFDGTHFNPSLLTLLPLVDYLIVSRFFANELASHDAGQGTGRAAARFAGESSGSQLMESPAIAGDVPEVHGEALLQIARQLRSHGPKVVVVTEGEHGSWCASDEGDSHTPSFPIEAVDTTGAGDVFHGAFLFARAQGWDLRRSLLLAAATAALKCRALGGRAGIPTLAEALALTGEPLH